MNIKFLVLGDLHGELPNIKIKDFDAIICPGDICGYFEEFLYDEDVETQEDLEHKTIEKGKKILEILDGYEKPVFLVSGNWDYNPYLDGIYNEEDTQKFQYLLTGYKNIQFIEDKLIEFEGINIIGYGGTSAPEPFLEKIDKIESFKNKRKKFMTRRFHNLNQLFSKSNKPTIVLSHNVPYNTKLDLIQSKFSVVNNQHKGSKIIRKLIETHNPLLCIGGHIHEGYGKEYINNTLCINAGYGSDVNTIIEIEDNKIKSVEFIGKNKI